MDNYCKTCKHVRTAEELGVASPVTPADELFCGKHPPQIVDVEPVWLPLCNDEQGYRNMSCWEAVDGRVTLSFDEDELAALVEAFERKRMWEEKCYHDGCPCSLLRMEYTIAQVRHALLRLRERAVGGSEL